jgi:hypothetical protein
LAEIDDFTVMASLMVTLMSEAEYRRSYRTEKLGDVLVRVLGRAAAQMEKNGGHVGAHTLDDVTAKCPGREERGHEGSRNRGKGVALRREFGGEDRRADAASLRGANDGSKEIRDAALLPLGEVGRDQAAPHGRPPFSNLATTASYLRRQSGS